MCHETPTAQLLGALVCGLGTIFILWHIWSYDRFRCLIPTRADIFRWIIVVMLVACLILFMAWNIILCYIKYKEWYTAIPLPGGGSEILPTPFQLWSERHQFLGRTAYTCMSVAWALLMSIQAEETLYWAYLIGSIRRRSSRTWFQSHPFKIWLVWSVISFVTVPTVAQIETRDLLKMESNLFLAGSISAIVVVSMNSWLVWTFPTFIKEARRQGANPDVLGRLLYFKELNLVRTSIRWIYVGAITTLALDSRTSHAIVNHSQFWLDALMVSGLFAAFTSTAISVLILLPRSLTAEANLGYKSAQVFVRAQRSPYRNNNNNSQKHQSQDRGSTKSSYLPSDSDVSSMHTFAAPWAILGDRLKLDERDVQELEDMEKERERERETERHGQVSATSTEGQSPPFAMQPGARVLAEGETLEDGPARMLDQFISPIEVNPPQNPVDLNIVVLTETTVDKE